MIRYAKLGYVEFNVTDLPRSENFYEHIVGLQNVGPTHEGAANFRCSDDQLTIQLHQASRPGCRAIGWMLEDDAQFDPLLAALDQAGVKHVALTQSECGARGLQRAHRITEPYSGARLEFYVGARGGEAMFEPTSAKIQRLGHVVLATPRAAEAVSFFVDVLNFRVSDRVENAASFLRCFPNPYHHSIAITPAETAHFHHLNMMVSEIDDIGKLHTRLKKNNVRIVYGPGRHPISNSIFLYFLDPDGITLEYSFGMETFPEVGARDARTLPKEPAWSDSWGSTPEPMFGKVGALSDD